MCVLSPASSSCHNQRRIVKSPARQEDSRPTLPVVLTTIICEGYTSPTVRGDRRLRGLTSCYENMDDSVKRENPSRCDHGLTIGVALHERASENQGGSSI